MFRSVQILVCCVLVGLGLGKAESLVQTNSERPSASLVVHDLLHCHESLAVGEIVHGRQVKLQSKGASPFARIRVFRSSSFSQENEVFSGAPCIAFKNVFTDKFIRNAVELIMRMAIADLVSSRRILRRGTEILRTIPIRAQKKWQGQ